MQGYDLLKKHKIPVPPHEIVKSADEAAKAAGKIGYPVVAKIVSSQVVHKSDSCGVITGIIIEKDMLHGLELIIGGKTDPSFGKILAFGLGGTLVELLKVRRWLLRLWKKPVKRV